MTQKHFSISVFSKPKTFQKKFEKRLDRLKKLCYNRDIAKTKAIDIIHKATV